MTLKLCITIFFVAISAATELQNCIREPDALCYDATCAEPFMDKYAEVPCECNNENIGEMFTSCDTTTNTRKLIYFWRPPATCLNGTLPEPVEGIPCAAQCGVGQHLNLTTMQCSNCTQGYVSSGSGRTWARWNQWPAQFATSCASTRGTCSPWRLLGDYVDSGNNFQVDYLTSTLELRVRLVKPGKVSFDYKVSAEDPYDKLYFIVDGLAYIGRSTVLNWTTFELPLAEGFHTLQWEYYKDVSLTSGDDRAYLRVIKVEGMSITHSRCEPCGLGEYQDEEGQSVCKPCPENHYNQDVIGAKKCEECPSWGYSFKGATKCIPRRYCGLEGDYTYSLTPCVNNTQVKQYKWILPRSCDDTGVSPPSDEEIPCQPEVCLPGTEIDPANPTQCKYCDAGYASSGGNTPCTSCTKGSASVPRVRKFDKWSENFPAGTGTWRTTCSGACFNSETSGGGWRLAEWYIDSGLGHDSNTFSDLSLSLQVAKGGSISFTYALYCDGDGDQLIFSIDDFTENGNRIFAVLNCNSCAPFDERWETFTVSVPWNAQFDEKITHTYNFKWSYHKVSAAVTGNTTCDRAIIKEITATGVAEGKAGAAQCNPCEPGTKSEQDTQAMCELCTPGTTSTLGATSCSACSNSSVTDSFGSSNCYKCGNNTAPSEDLTECIYNCTRLTVRDTVTGRDRLYNLSSISNEVTLTTGTWTFSGSLCHKNPACKGYFCFVDSNRTDSDSDIPRNLGKIPTIDIWSDDLIFRFEYGDVVNGTSCRTDVHLVCDPAAPEDSLPKLDTSSTNLFTPNCEAHFNWATRYGCPLCSEEDYATVDTECKDNHLTRNYYWINRFCYGGAKLPEPEMHDCKETVKVDKGAITGLVIGAGVILLVAVVGIAVLVRKNRKLYAEYSRLANNVPMEDDG